MPEIRRIASTEPEYSITANATVTTNWDIAAARCLDWVTNKTQYADAAKWFPTAGTSAADAETDMLNKTLDETITVNIFLVQIAAGGTYETWYSQKTYSEMISVSGIIVNKWAYNYIYQEGNWYSIMGRPCSERLGWQMLKILKDDVTLQSLIKTFRHDDYSDFRIPSNHVPLLMVVPSNDWERWGEDISDVGHHAIDVEIFVAYYQRISGDHAAMGANEMRVRERIIEMFLIENPRFKGYLSEEPISNPFDAEIEKEIEAWRGEHYRRLVMTVKYRDRISNKAAERIY